VSPQFLASGGLSGMTGVVNYTPLLDTPGLKDSSRHAQYDPTVFFVYEATLLVVDAIRRAGSDQPAAIHQALKTSTMPSLLGGTYAFNNGV